MKAAVIHAPHDLRIEECDTPGLGARDVKLRIRNGGICGSDLHYFHDGGFGTVRIQEPMILGHEVAGEVVEIGSAVTRVRPGDTVAVNPSLPCNACRYCLEGQQQHCLDMRFYGSAMRMPHVQGGFREVLVCAESQAVPADMPLHRAAFAEPLSVCLHAARQAGPLMGRRVLVTGAGPIGALCAMVARHAGAREIVATDLMDEPLATVRRIGADRTINVATDAQALAAYGADKGYFDVVFEASGSGAALAGALQAARPRATIVQVGIGAAETPVPLNVVVAKEMTLRGTFRFHAEFELAVQMLASGALDVAPLLTEIVPLAEATRAFTLATDRKRAMKVQLAL
ncbi:L-idonate 5-dehydrogenase [Limobrevibacterium gyesilva]|uniref:L-idonate 5-dehydrogenase n=1 Tax=Limobrevibacterium gyesilva TaxID=2991712 RepID=A0AA42CEQ7_9PROT|nr:L-idonate 5-dehydrogenase [Limobrevibacterium gyesilva]MCW3475594.1 L-idonate 5-dehydrogenase [Limobrevibacterium gyesilva]